MFRDAGGSIRRDIDEARSGVAFNYDHYGVFHCAFLAEFSHNLCDRRGALPDRTIDANHILPTLVEDTVDRDGGLARLSIPQNQFALPAPDGNERVDDLQPSLQRYDDGLAIHDRR